MDYPGVENLYILRNIDQTVDNKRINYITSMQIMATAIIVLSHSVVSTIQYPHGTGTIIALLQKAGLTAFMWCSGFLLVKTDSIKRYGYKLYLHRRFIRLMVPFFVVQIIMLFPKVLISRFIGQPIDISIYSFVHSFIYPREGILPHLWFLPTLMLLCIISPVLLWLSDTGIKWVFTLILFALLILVPLETNILCINDAKNYLFWYFLGVGSATYFDVYRLKDLSKILSGIVIIFIVLLISGLFFLQKDLGFMIGILTLPVLLFLSINCAWGGVEQVIGQYTFPIYILSLPVQNIVEIIAGKLRIDWLAASILMFVSGIAVPVLLAALTKKLEGKMHLRIVSRCIGL